MDPTIHTTTSADGTTIGYLTVGDGPPLTILHGAMQSGWSQLDLAMLLADRHTVHLVDRRGRGAQRTPIRPTVATRPADASRPTDGLDHRNWKSLTSRRSCGRPGHAPSSA